MKRILLKKIEEHYANVFYKTKPKNGGKYKNPLCCVYRGDSVVCVYDDGKNEMKGFLYSFRSYNSGSDGLFNQPKIYRNSREVLVEQDNTEIYPCSVVIFEKTIFEDKF